MAPTHRRKRDQKGWGKSISGYTVSLGYIKLNERPYVPPNPDPWRGVWRIPSLPKINFFAWQRCHTKILTYDILQKKCFYDPSICSLCSENAESAVHLFLECNFSKQVWTSLIQNLDPNFKLPGTMADLFSNWATSYPGPAPKNQTNKTAWAVLPKIISWQIWLERNRRIFRNTKQNHKILENKIKCQIKECLANIKDDSKLSQQDIIWGSILGLQFQPAIRNTPIIKDWQIRKFESDFQDWIETQARHSLFFDGVAKGNPGKAGAGGVVLNPIGEKFHSYAWCLEYSSSIQMEALALLQGLKTLKELNIKEANVIGDSQIIINAMATKSPALDINLARLITRIKGLESYFQDLRYYHVLRTHNKETDIEANKVVLLSAGTKMKDGKETWDPIP